MSQDNESKVMKHILGYTDLQCQECGEQYTIGPTTEPPEDGLCESCRQRQKQAASQAGEASDERLRDWQDIAQGYKEGASQ